MNDPLPPGFDLTSAADSSPPERAWAEPRFGPPQHAGEVGTLGRYRVLRQLGRGGMGAVYLGFHPALGRKVALKVMLPALAADNAARERFLREARTAAAVRSEHVVTIHDVDEAGGVPFIAMEYLLGSPLDQFLKTKGELPLDQALRVARETALGLEAAHTLGLIHRDVKPGNIWLEAPQGKVKLLDFGLARAADDDEHLTNSGAVVGSPAYMSPEQGRGQKVDHRTDLWSLGVLLYRLCTGRMPFTGQGTMAVLTSLAVDTPAAPRALNPDLPEAVERVILTLLSKDPAGRYQSAAEVAAVLGQLAAGELPSVVAVPVPTALAVGAQTQNVWEGIEDSGSVAVPLADGATSAARPARMPAGPSRLAVALAAGAVVVAIAAVVGVVAFVGRERRPVEPAEADKRDVPRPPARPDTRTPDRKAAEFVLRAGGVVQVDGVPTAIKTVADLPPGHFALTYAELKGSTKATDADLAVFAGCTDLTTLWLGGSPQLTDAGLVHFKGCKGLRVLFLEGTAVGDAGLAHCRECKSLTRVDLSGTRVTDVGLEALKDCSELAELVLSNTSVSGAGFVHFKDRKGLKTLNLERTPVTDAGLAHLKGCTGLDTLNLGGCLQLTDAGLEAFAGCTDLTILELHATRVTDAGLAHFKGCKGLKNLTLGGSETQVTDVGLAFFKGCAGMSQMRLNNVQATDTFFTDFKDCKDLYYLDLRGTRVTKAGVEAFAESHPNCQIEWTGGVIPRKTPDRAAAEWVLAHGGGVELKGGGTVTKPADLPAEFRVVGAVLKKATFADADLVRLRDAAELRNLDLSGTAVTDDGLARVAELKSLRGVLLSGCPKVTDGGMKHLRGLPLLNNLSLTGTRVGDDGVRALGGHQLLYYVYLSGTKVTDAGLAHLPNLPALLGTHLNGLPITDAGLAHVARCPQLRDLALADTAVTDEGLKNLEPLTTLRTLDLKKTKVTKAGVDRLAKALPRCLIDWDGGTIAPAKK